MIQRKLENQLVERIADSNEIIVLYGARQSGKTKLIQHILRNHYDSVLEINAEERKYQNILSSADISQFKRLVSGYKILFVDEAQCVQNIGLNLKIIRENFPDLKLIAASSFSFKLGNQSSDMLIGGTATFKLFPISVLEFTKFLFRFELDEKLYDFLLYGMYPEIFNYEKDVDKKEYLKQLTHSMIYRDILESSQIKNPGKIYDLLRLLAFQVGKPVSYNELGRRLGLSTDTVISYVELLEKIFVIFRLGGFSKNLKKEMTQNKKVYFYDTGVRNALIEDFTPPERRPDIGSLWKNFIIAERIKRNHYLQSHVNSFFWKTYTGAKLDYVEQDLGKLYGFNIDWGKKAAKVPQSWIQNYSGSQFNFVNESNYQDFIAE